MAKRKHLIIGSGSAGLSAAEEIRRLNSEDEIKVVSGENYPPYSPTALPYLLSGRTDETKLPMRKDDYFDGIRVTLACGKEVTSLIPKNKEVVFKDGEKETYDTLLIASGADWSQPPIIGLKESGCLGFHTIDDCKRLLKEIDGKEDIAVLGAGLVGMEVAISLSEREYRVTIVEKEPRMLPLYFDQEAESLMRGPFLAQGVRLLTDTEITEVKRRNGKIEIYHSQGGPIRVDVMVCCTGVRARTNLVEGSGIRVGEGILVDRRMATNIKDVYAAGDVAAAMDFFAGKCGMNQTIISAVDQGRIAGSNMAGVPAEYEGWISGNLIHFFCNTAVSVGLSMPEGNGYQVLSRKDDQKAQFTKLVFDGDRLVGAMFLNVDVDPGVILYLIQRKVVIGAHKDVLFEQPKEISRWLMLETEQREAALVKG